MQTIYAILVEFPEVKTLARYIECELPLKRILPLIYESIFQIWIWNCQKEDSQSQRKEFFIFHHQIQWAIFLSA
jgi:hypothetical protein